MYKEETTAVRRFRLSEVFIDQYRDQDVPWGPLGYITFKRTYARRLNEFDPDVAGTEEWYQTCRRVIEGMFNIQKQHVARLGLEWNDGKAQRTAKEAYDRLFNLKWTPPGRGLWMMGTRFLQEKTGAGLFNCAFRSTKELSSKGGYLFSWMMDALMVGIGVGFDTKGASTTKIKEPQWLEDIYKIPDSREGWVESVRIMLDGYFFGAKVPQFDYSLIRPAGAPIRGFGGTSSGPKPLMELHRNLIELYGSKTGEIITSVDIVDTENLIGRCVVAGNVRRSAALALGEHDDMEYLSMKNDEEKLYHHRWGSNNSFIAEVGMNYEWHAKQSQTNGEPGYIWLENARTRGRFKDPPRDDDRNVMGFNPCVEQQLEDAELCCLVETFPAKHDSYEDYLRTLKIAYLYGKTVTLVNTHWPETNAIMLKNRRIGLSQSGVVQAFNKHGRRQMFEWCDKAYGHVQQLDEEYSDWLCIPRSVRVTSIKPSGTVSLLNGSTPGMHFQKMNIILDV
jgi:ribonucleoside-triphosphate reductase